MTKLAPEWVRTSDPVIRNPARYGWTTAPTFCSSWNKAYNFFTILVYGSQWNSLRCLDTVTRPIYLVNLLQIVHLFDTFLTSLPGDIVTLITYSCMGRRAWDEAIKSMDTVRWKLYTCIYNWYTFEAINFFFKHIIQLYRPKSHIFVPQTDMPFCSQFVIDSHSSNLGLYIYLVCITSIGYGTHIAPHVYTRYLYSHVLPIWCPNITIYCTMWYTHNLLHYVIHTIYCTMWYTQFTTLCDIHTIYCTMWYTQFTTLCDTHNWRSISFYLYERGKVEHFKCRV